MSVTSILEGVRATGAALYQTVSKRVIWAGRFISSQFNATVTARVKSAVSYIFNKTDSIAPTISGKIALGFAAAGIVAAVASYFPKKDLSEKLSEEIKDLKAQLDSLDSEENNEKRQKLAEALSASETARANLEEKRKTPPKGWFSWWPRNNTASSERAV